MKRSRWSRLDWLALAITLAILTLIWQRVDAQQQPSPTPPPRLLTPTEVQALRLENAQLKVRALIQQAQDLWNATCAQVKRENNWPDAAACDLNSSPVRVFVPEQPKPAQEKKP